MSAGQGPSAPTHAVPTRRLSLLWFFSLGGMGFFLPFYTLYLSDNAGLSGAQIGVVLAAIPAMGAVAQLLWGPLADRTGRRRLVLAFVALGCVLGHVSLGVQSRFAGFVAATAALALFSQALMPMCMSVTFALAGSSDGHLLGRTRVWGTLGFAVFVIGFPFVLPLLPGAPPSGPAPDAAEPALGWIFPGAALVYAAAGLTAFALPRTGSVGVRSERGEWRSLLREPAFVRMLVVTFLCFLSMQGAILVFPVLVQSQGGGVEAISRMWVLMLALEVPLVFSFGRSLGRVGVRGVIGIGLAAAGVRWLVSGFVDDLAWIAAVQVLHGVTVWGVILGLPVYTDLVVPEQLRSTGQSVAALLGPCLAGVLSNLTAGWLIESFGPAAPARVSGVLALLTALALPWLLPRPVRRVTPGSRARAGANDPPR